MKQLDLNKSFTIEFNNQCPTCDSPLAPATTKEIKYSDLIEGMLNSQPQGGFVISEMSARIDILNKIKEGGIVTLDDADVEKIFNLANAATYVIMDRGYVEFYEYLKSVQESKGG